MAERVGAGERALRWRLRKRLKQQAVAEKAGMAAASLSRFEQGLQGLRSVRLERVVAALGMRMKEFYGKLPPRPKSE